MSRELVELFMIIVFVGMVCAYGGRAVERPPKPEKEELDWMERAGLQLITVAIGFIAVIALTHGLSRRSDAYKLYMTFFFGFLLMNFMAIFVFLSIGLSMSYGDEFSRKMYLIDPRRNTTKTIIDDGAYVIENGTVIGLQQPGAP